MGELKIKLRKSIRKWNNMKWTRGDKSMKSRESDQELQHLNNRKFGKKLTGKVTKEII